MQDATTVPATSSDVAAKRRFGGLEGLRTIGVVAVFFTHNGLATGVTFGSRWTMQIAGHVVRPAMLLGHLEIGPAIFFTISAFLLYRPFALACASGAPMPSLKTFLRRRGVRVFPAYWFTIAILVITHSIVLRTSLQWFRVLTLTQIYREQDFFAFATLVPTWTLATELTFYILLVAYAPLMRRIGNRVQPERRMRCEVIGASVLFAGAWLFRSIVYSSSLFPHVGEHWIFGTADRFAVGIAFAAIEANVCHGARLPRVIRSCAQHPNLCAVGALVSFLCVPLLTNASAGIGFSTGWDAFGRDGFQLLCATLLLVPLVFGDERVGVYRRFTQLRPVAYIGAVSYGIYLWHDHWIVEALRWSGGRPAFIGHFWLVGVVAFALSLACGAASYRFLERPVLLADARWSRSRPARTTPA